MAPFKSEADFQTKMLDHIKKKWGFWFKIADSDRRLKPCDCVVTIWKDTYWLELKYKWPKSHHNILQHQENSCRRVWDAGGKYFFLEYDACTHSMQVMAGFIPYWVDMHPEMALQLLWLDDFLV